MTLQELYTSIDGNYAHAAQIMKMDKLISRYVLKFPNSSLNEELQAAGESMDSARLFEAAHAMKGVCANMGFDKLSDAAGVICEEFRPGSSRSLSDEEIRMRLRDIDGMYQRTVEGIRAYEQSL